MVADFSESARAGIDALPFAHEYCPFPAIVLRFRASARRSRFHLWTFDGSGPFLGRFEQRGVGSGNRCQSSLESPAAGTGPDGPDVAGPAVQLGTTRSVRR